MKSKIELLFWPGETAGRVAERLSSYSVEAAKVLVRQQVELGQATLRVLDPKEFVAHRRQEIVSEEGRLEEVHKLGKELRDHDPAHPEYHKLVSFNAQSMLKLLNQWAADGDPISKDGRDLAEKFLRGNNVPDEITMACLDQLQIERPAEAPGPVGIPSQIYNEQTALFEVPFPTS